MEESELNKLNNTAGFLLGLGKHIALKRQQTGITQNELALRCGMYRQNMNRIEKGEINLTVTTLRKIAFHLGITIKDLVDF